MAAPVTKWGVLTGGADLQRPARTGKFVAAISAQAEHPTAIGSLHHRAKYLARPIVALQLAE